MSGFKPYPAYKDSGVEWLGEVPEHWNSGMLRWYATIQGGVAKGKDYEGRDTITLPYLRVANVQDGFVDLTEVKEISVLESELERYSLWPGDVLMNEGGDNDKLGRGAVWQGQVKPCLHQNHVFAIRPNDLLKSEWLAAFTGSQPARTYFFLSSKQSTNLASISASNIMGLVVPIPPIAEQAQVLRFLEHETARIDALIEEQQRLIELLKEKRQAVISLAVTKGLDPTVPMKDSGVEWLGEVPAHWIVSKLKFMTDQVVDCPHETPIYDPDGDYLVIRTADVDQGVLKPEQMYRLDRDQYHNRTRRKTLEKYDVVYSREGERWGHAALVSESNLYALGQRMMQFCVSDNVCPMFFMYQLNSIATYRQGEVDTVGATAPHVNISTVINYDLMLPPHGEQEQISQYLSSVLDALDCLIGESTDTVELLNERRSALISAAVTGKIDVRGWQPPANVSSPVLEEAV